VNKSIRIELLGIGVILLGIALGINMFCHGRLALSAF
jgi:hypothetical protein